MGTKCSLFSNKNKDRMPLEKYSFKNKKWSSKISKKILFV
jgi:hypothetical protein